MKLLMGGETSGVGAGKMEGMFTGIVQALGTLTAITSTSAGKRLTIALNELSSAPITLGDSVCISGVCLTATSLTQGLATFDVITETLNHSTLGQKRIGDRVNLELSLQPTSYLGGHFVQGHVDTLGKLVALDARPEDWRPTFEVPPEFIAYIAPKGSIAVDGVSMTIAQVTDRTFTLAVIPTTLARTTLAQLKLGDMVNVETDMLARTVIHYLQHAQQTGATTPALTMEKLMAAGLA